MKYFLKTLSLLVLQIHLVSINYANPNSTTISVIVPALVQITGLNDISLSPINFGSPATGSTTACIYTNVLSPLGSYYVTASSANVLAGTFRVVNAGNYVTYSAFWSRNSTPSQTVALTSGTKTAQQTGGSSTSLTCSGSPNANFNIQFTSAQITGARAATYTDTVTLLISPS